MSTSLDDILDELLTTIELGEADCRRLVRLHAKIEPQFGDIADRFYARIDANPRAAALVSGPEQRARLRQSLVEWMGTGLLGPYDTQFYDKRSRIGRRHVAIGLPQHFMFTAMNLIRSEYDDRIGALFEPLEARLVAKAAHKLLDLELALMLRHYQLDSEAKLVSRERQTQTERMAAIQTLTAGLAHEVRNPLNSATLQLELLERRMRRANSDPKLVEPIELANQEIARLTRLLNEFLAFARPTDLMLGEYDVVSIARDVIAAEAQHTTARGSTVTLIDHEPVIARVDVNKVYKIVQNLIRNAVDAVATGGTVAVVVTGDATHVRLRVDDDGPGIPDDIRARIYEPFFTTKAQGTGLGMAIVHSMVTLHGGTIDIDSSSRGTRVNVAMPR